MRVNVSSPQSIRSRKKAKQRSLVCKMWNAKGDSTSLSTGRRGSYKTSMSACVFIQPITFANDLLQISADDGLIDRFLVFSARPVFHQTQILMENGEKLNTSIMKDFQSIFVQMFKDRTDVTRNYQIS